NIYSLETIVIDYALLPENIPNFVSSLQQSLKESNIPCPPDGPKLVVVAAESMRVDFSRLLNANVAAFVYKPVAIRRFLYLIAFSMENVHTVYKYENIPWKTDRIAAKIARETEIVEISEFGTTIKSAQPLKPGSMFYLFKSIFTNAPDQNLCVRVYHSAEN